KGIGPLVIRAFWQGGCFRGGIEFVVQTLSPIFDLFPRHLASPDCQQLFSMFLHPDRHKTLPQDGDSREQQSDQVHDMLPLHLALVTKVGLHLLELREDVAVVCGRLLSGAEMPHPERKDMLSTRTSVPSRVRLQDRQTECKRRCNKRACKRRRTCVDSRSSC